MLDRICYNRHGKGNHADKNAEMGRKNIRGMQADITKSPNYYGVFLFQTKEMVANAMKLPHPRKKIAEGFVFQEGGPQQTDMKTGHICWWLFEHVDFSNFKLVE